MGLAWIKGGLPRFWNFQSLRLGNSVKVLSCCSFYRKHIKDFVEIAAPLNRLTSPKVPFSWDESCTQSFEKLKECLTTAPILANPIKDGKFILECDASDFAMGGCLYQIQDGEKKVIAYASKKFTEQQKRAWSTLEKELASLLWNIDDKFRPYLEFSTFDVYTDNYALSWLRNLKNPNGKLARLSYKLQQYSFTCYHKKGSEKPFPISCPGWTLRSPMSWFAVVSKLIWRVLQFFSQLAFLLKTLGMIGTLGFGTLLKKIQNHTSYSLSKTDSSIIPVEL